jgi:probable selenium-dependent hydroxylase accessory protein YqeC
MKLKKLLDLKDGDVLSIAGAGGKTTLMFAIAQELRKEFRVLVTTSTKIYAPSREQYDFIAIGYDDFNRIKSINQNGIYVFGASVNEQGKIIGPGIEALNTIIDDFDYALIEADGSRGRPIKGWNANEPVISYKTSKTIGVLSIEAIGKEISENNVHRVEEFLKVTNNVQAGKISVKDLHSVIFHPDGLFKASSGERILFINKVENMAQMNLVEELVRLIEIENRKNRLLDRIIIGSLKNRQYMQIECPAGDALC